ncbi:MAG TPA: Zn-ribbon containing protein [Methanoregulaceae archaeon]|nr:Zn-ribbon containing protein [Methanoregulaceae archaeon]HOV68388.1 Zn-ribbon containing protein [Methanoregulaceae archaeon]HQJ88557.1 Zn-ribbon containing protein [Methanoregulaceae archaeon]
MPHKCTTCGREFEDGSQDVLRGCPSCGGKRFLYVRAEERHRDVLEETPLETLVEEAPDEDVHEIPVEVDEVPEHPLHESIETIRIRGPGSYEINIERLAQSDEMVIGLGKAGQYGVDILSMGKKRGRRRRRTRRDL